MSEELQRAYVPARTLDGPFPLIDSDPHIKRVFKYARPSDWAVGAAVGGLSPGLMLLWEKFAPSHVGKGGFASIMRLSGFIGFTGAILMVMSRSSCRFYGLRENKLEVERDMREMVQRVKDGEPLYGKSSLSVHMQGVASRNSRYTGVFLHVVPWANFVNHQQHGVDTAKYYQQAERELEAERTHGT